MKVKKLIYILSAGFVLLMGCQKDPYPYITLDEVKKIDSLVHPAIANVAFIYNGDVYYATDFTKPVVQVTKSGEAAKYVRLSHDHSKFAYIDYLGKLTIVDGKGTKIATLTQYSNIQSFDWSADDKTLYILNSGEMYFYGPNMNLPRMSAESFNKLSGAEVISASVSMEGDLAYILKARDFEVGDQYELVIQRADGGKAIEYRPDGFFGRPDYVSFSAHAQDLVVGYIDENAYFTDIAQQNLEFFTDLNSSPSGHFGTVLTPTPVYNSKLNYIVIGGQNKSGARVPEAYYLGKSETTTYTGANVAQPLYLDKFDFMNILYIDWK